MNIVKLIDSLLALAVLFSLVYPYVIYARDHRSLKGAFNYIGESYSDVVYMVTHNHPAAFVYVIGATVVVCSFFTMLAAVIGIGLMQASILIKNALDRGHIPMSNNEPL